MEKQIVTEKNKTILGYILEATKNIFTAKEDLVANTMSDISDWDDCVKNINKFDDDDKETIKNIMNAEKQLDKRKEQVKTAKKTLESQIENPKKRSAAKMKIVEKNDKERIN